MPLSTFRDSKYISIVAETLIAVGIIGFIFYLTKKVISGHGLEQYISMAGIKVSYLEALMAFASIPIIVLIAGIFIHYSKKDERDFKKKYEIKDE